MVPCVPIIIILYTKATISSLKVKYLKMNKNRNGASTTIIIQLINESQFFLFLNTFNLEKNSLKICWLFGFARLPLSSVHPYAGGSSTVFKNAINWLLA